jgi:hypothetical protein
MRLRCFCVEHVLIGLGTRLLGVVAYLELSRGHCDLWGGGIMICISSQARIKEWTCMVVIAVISSSSEGYIHQPCKVCTDVNMCHCCWIHEVGEKGLLYQYPGLTLLKDMLRTPSDLVGLTVGKKD